MAAGPALTLDEFLAYAAGEPRIVGAVLTGSRGREATWELEAHPLGRWPAGELLGRIEPVLAGDATGQQALFRQVEERAREAGLGDVVDAWEADLPSFRGE